MWRWLTVRWMERESGGEEEDVDGWWWLGVSWLQSIKEERKRGKGNGEERRLHEVK